MTFYQPFFFNLTDKIQHLLCSAYRKRWDDNISPLIKSGLYDFSQFFYIVRFFIRMDSIPIGGFHDYIICILGISRILYKWLIQISHIAGENNLLCNISLRNPNLNAGRAKQMTNICKADFNAFTKINLFSIGAANQTFYCTIRIFQGIQWHRRLHLGTSFCLSVFPLSFLHLDMSTVTQHDTTQICCCLCSHDLSPESLCIQKRQKSGMIHMCMGKQHIINECFLHRQFHIFKIVLPLFHAIVHQNMLSACFQVMATARHFMIRTNKH